MSAVIVSIPAPIWGRYGKAREAVTLRARAIGASPGAIGHALHVLLSELQAGRSAAAAVALANSSLRRPVRLAFGQSPEGGAA